MFRRYKRFLLRVAILLLGLYCCGCALWNMGKTAIFLHESTVLTARIVDMVQRPFESYTQAMAHGNLPWEGDTAYQATVALTLPATPVAIEIPRLQLPDLDNRDYDIGQEVDVIVPISYPERAHLYRWKFQWGADTMLLLLGLALAGSGYMLLRRSKKAKRAAKRDRRPAAAPLPPVPLPAPPPAPKSRTSAAKPARKPRKKAQAEKVVEQAVEAAAEEIFQLVSDPPPKKKRTRKPKTPNASPSPRRKKN